MSVTVVSIENLYILAHKHLQRLALFHNITEPPGRDVVIALPSLILGEPE